jgi:glutamate synthase domain-containing protein 2
VSEYLVSADDLQIKMAQGAKPGERPAARSQVTVDCEGVRDAWRRTASRRHHDIYSIEDRAQRSTT